MKTDSTSNSPADAMSVALDQLNEYPAVRDLATEILQTEDFSDTRRTEFLQSARQAVKAAPQYWLAHSVLALTLWIKDQKEACQRAVSASEELNAAKTALFWVLVCQRAGRPEAAAQWLQQYLAKQDETDLDEECLVLIDAYTNGLLGDGSSGEIVCHLKSWFNKLSKQQAQTDQATDTWLAYFRNIRTRVPASEYHNLRQFSPDWPALKEAIEAQMSSEKISHSLQRINAADYAPEAVEQRLNNTLLSLLSQKSAEELDCAKSSPTKTKTDFLQMLAEAGTNSGHVPVSGLMQKHALYLNRQWALTAYACTLLEAQHIMRQPVNLTINGFRGTSIDGRNKQELTAEYDAWLEHEKKVGMESQEMSCGYAIVVILGVIAFLICKGVSLANDAGADIMGGWLIFPVIFTWIAWYVVRKGDKNKAKKDQATRANLDIKRTDNIKAMRNTLDEIIEIQAHFASEPTNHKAVKDYLKNIAP